ncbi:MAG: TonB-dependent receptor [Gammaproteobacteria bacterium]|nr:TonB-dependent receptor [Gammaproteobacteria bacterium]MDH4315846.1 TonB-dependent receptor [Gammaproteobacteria bacterium]MDH5214784.1 TonB-dependent receptor [Gammaproteobacteria bacterium]
MSSNNAIRSAVRHALCVGALATVAGYTPLAAAQGTEGEVLEEITVTGSRIIRKDYQSASPISTVDAALFEQTGAPTIETVLNTLPQFVPAITTTSNNPSNGGQANVSLRGIGTNRTLVLMDGRRIVPSNATGVVDLNLIPASIIENVEVITGGASAVYGSDAIAGVVNIKTREFVGLELSTNYGITSEDDGQTTGFGITGGLQSSDGRGYAFGTFNYADRESITQGDRKFSEVSVDWNGSAFVPLGSSTIRQGRWDAISSNAPTQAALDAYFLAQDPGYNGLARPGHNYGFNPDGSIFDVAPVINFTGDANEPLQPVNPASYTYNYAPPNYLQLPLERKSFFGRAGFEVNENVEIYSQFLWADYQADQALAPTPLTGVYISASNPNIDPDVATLLASRPDPTAPFAYRKRMEESGPRISSNSYEVMQALAGLKGSLPFAQDWSYDVYGSWGNVEQTESQLGNISRTAFEEITLAADHGASICGAAVNPFGIGAISPACAAHFTRSATNNTNIRQSVLEGFVTGPMFEMPAGSAQAAVGVLYKKDEYAFLPDASLTATSTDPLFGNTRTDIVGFNAQDVVRGDTDSKEIYVEGSLPLLADKPGVELLELTLGYRFADHSAAGTMSSYKAEGVWDITQSFSMRGGYQRAVRAPNISELFRPATINFPSVGLGDPCSNDFNDPSGNVVGAQDSAAARALCVAQGIPDAAIDSYNFANTQFQGLSGGNPNLSEETADTYTVGLVFQPSGGVLEGFSASVDYYKIEIADAISAIDADVFVERCFNPDYNPSFDNSNFYCGFFSRLPGTNTITDALEVDTNIAAFETDGVDLQLEYGMDVGPGQLDLHWISSYLMNWDDATIQGEPFTRNAGTASSGFDALPEWKWTASVGYAVAGFDGDIRWRHVGEMTDFSFPTFKLDAVEYLDLNLGYSFSDALEGLRIRAGVTNLTDEDPIIYPSQQQSNTDPSTYDILGRRYYVSLTYRFQ